jgi:hypothetical protein
LTISAPLDLIGNPVRIGSGPAAVIGDELRIRPLFGQIQMGRREASIDPKARRPALMKIAPAAANGTEVISISQG